jgi:predicted nuclease of predicted toxin-antitoxin system
VRFLVDECCDISILNALRAVESDVLSVSDSLSGASDAEVIALAVSESRTLITEDKDFGQLVYAAGHGHCGVILLRYPFPLASKISDDLVRLLHERGEVIRTSFVVLQPGKARILKSIG